jgi:superfamily II DNA or RNA helicase
MEHLLIKLKECLTNFYENKIDNLRVDGRVFEIVSALILQSRYSHDSSYVVKLWEEISPIDKAKLGLPQLDVGVDYALFQNINGNNIPILFGQAKDYNLTSYVKAKDIDRTRFCWYRGNNIFSEKFGSRPIQTVEFTTPENVKLGSPKVVMEKGCVHTIISDDWFNYFIQEALKMDTPGIDNSDVENYISSRLGIRGKIKKNKKSIKNKDDKIISNNLDNPVIISNTLENTFKLDLTNINLSKLNDYVITDNLDDNSYTESEFDYELRRCQIEALNKINPEGITRLKICCGAGKSLIPIEYMRRNPGTYLILVPYLILQEQWNNIVTRYGFETILIGTNNHRSEDQDFENKVTICVYNSFENIEDINYDMIFSDESHHIKEDKAENYMKLISDKILGIPSVLMSATLLKYDYNYTIRDAIEDKVIVDYDINIPFFEQLNNFSDSVDIDKYVEFEALADYLKNNFNYTSILGYCKTIDRCEGFVKVCHSRNITAASLSYHDSIKVRKQVISDFQKGVYRILVTVNILSEGINIPRADTCLFIEPRESYNFVTQAIGRVLRLRPGKRLAHVIIPTIYSDNFDVNKSGIMEILSNLNSEDNLLLELNSNRTAKINCELVKSKQLHREDEVIAENMNKNMKFIFESIFDSMLKGLCWGNWNYKYELLNEFYKINGRFPMNSEMYNNIKIGKWFAYQKEHYRSNTLSEDRIIKINSISNDWNKKLEDINDEKWNLKYEQLVGFYNENNRFPKCEELYNNIRIGGWISHQREYYRSNKLSKYKIDKLVSISIEWNKSQTSKSDENWNFHYEQLIIFYKEYNRLPKDNRIKDVETKLAQWIVQQRQKLKNERLDQIKLDKLKIIPNLIPTGDYILDDNWNQKYDIFYNFYHINGRLPTLRDTYLDKNLGNISIGTWISYQIQKGKNGKLSNDRIEKLNCIDGWNKKTKIIPFIDNDKKISIKYTLNDISSIVEKLFNTNNKDDSIWISRFIKEIKYVYINRKYSLKEYHQLAIVWISNERKKLKKGIMTDDRLFLIETAFSEKWKNPKSKFDWDYQIPQILLDIIYKYNV